MIPMDDASARKAYQLRPDGWDKATVWPVWPERMESDSGPSMWHYADFTRWPGEVAADIQRWIEAAVARKKSHMVIVTRSEMVMHRARRMMLEGAPIEVSIHFPGSDYPPATVLPSGDLDAWPAGVFGETASEVGAILRAMGRRWESEEQR